MFLIIKIASAWDIVRTHAFVAASTPVVVVLGESGAQGGSGVDGGF